jgi:hypothetical protein
LPDRCAQAMARPPVRRIAGLALFRRTERCMRRSPARRRTARDPRVLRGGPGPAGAAPVSRGDGNARASSRGARPRSAGLARSRPGRWRHVIGAGERQRRHPVDGLAADAERLALVATRCTSGQRRRIASAVFAQVPIRCSQLSSTIRTFWKARASSSPSRTARPGCSPIPRASEMAEGTASPSKTVAISTSQTPSPDPSSSSAATWRASLVLPAPPAPVSVTRREDPARARISASSRSRPMKADSWAGRLFGSAGLPSERSGGNSARRPAACSWKIRSGRPRSFSRWTPRSRSVAPGGSESRTRAAAVSERTTCPPCATAASRAARWTSRPTKPVAVLDASPVYIPIRTRTPSPPGQVRAARARCISIAAATQAVGDENTAKNASPWVSASSPS